MVGLRSQAQSMEPCPLKAPSFIPVALCPLIPFPVPLYYVAEPLGRRSGVKNGCEFP